MTWEGIKGFLTSTVVLGATLVMGTPLILRLTKPEPAEL